MQIVLVNDQDKIVGYKEKFAAYKIPVPLHRAISVVILDSSGEKMLLQKRAAGKPTWPLFWSNTCCTHPLRDESYQACAERRLKVDKLLEDGRRTMDENKRLEIYRDFQRFLVEDSQAAFLEHLTTYNVKRK